MPVSPGISFTELNRYRAVPSGVTKIDRVGHEWPAGTACLAAGVVAATAAAAAVAATAAEIPTAAVAEQQDQNDQPAQIPIVTAVITHSKYLRQICCKRCRSFQHILEERFRSCSPQLFGGSPP